LCRRVPGLFSRVPAAAIVLFPALALALASCARNPAIEADKEVTTLGTVEVTAQLMEIPGPFPANDLYNYAYVLKYRVLKVHRGQAPGAEILVGQYNPLKPRATVQDDASGKVGGHLDAFRAGDVHRMALDAPLDQFWMGGIIDKYFEQPGARYWAVWTNPGTK
jgi:hypothetical protein